MAPRRLRFGIFLAPFHRVGDNPTLAIDRDLKLIEWLAGEKAQHIYADTNFEYPLRAGVAINPIIASYGALKADSLPLAKIADNKKAASALVDKVGFDN